MRFFSGSFLLLATLSSKEDQISSFEASLSLDTFAAPAFRAGSVDKPDRLRYWSLILAEGSLSYDRSDDFLISLR